MYIQTGLRSSKAHVTCDICCKNFDVKDIRIHLESFHPDSHKGFTVLQQFIHHYEKNLVPLYPLYIHQQPPSHPTPTIKSQKVINSSKNLMNQPQSYYFVRPQYPPSVGQPFQTHMNNDPYHHYEEVSNIHATSYDAGKGKNQIITKPQNDKIKSDIEAASNTRVDSMHNSRQRRGQYQIDQSLQTNYIVDVKSNHQKSKGSRKLVLKPIVEPQEYLIKKDQEEPYKIQLNRETLNFRNRDAGSRVKNMNQRGGEKKIQAAAPSREVKLNKTLVDYQRRPINYQQAYINQKQYNNKAQKKKVLYMSKGVQVRKQLQPQKLPEYRFEPNKQLKQPPTNKSMYVSQRDKISQQPQQEIKRAADKKVIKLNSSKAQYVSEKEKMRSISVNQEQKKQKNEQQASSHQIKLAYSQIQYHGDIYVKQLTLNEKQKIDELELKPEKQIKLYKSRIYYDQENPEKKQIFLNLYQESERINLPEHQYHYQKVEKQHPVRNFSPITHQQLNYKNSYIKQSNVIIKEKNQLKAKQKHVLFNKFIQKPQLKPDRACECIEQSKRNKTKNRLFNINLQTSKAETDINKQKIMDGLMIRIYQLIGKKVSENQAQKCIQAYQNRKTNQTLNQFILKYF